jgi:hypothetical protein
MRHNVWVVCADTFHPALVVVENATVSLVAESKLCVDELWFMLGEENPQNVSIATGKYLKIDAVWRVAIIVDELTRDVLQLY